MSETRIVPPDEAREAERGEIQLTRGHYFALAHTSAVLGEQREAALALHSEIHWCTDGGDEPKLWASWNPCPTARALGVTDA